MLDMGRLDEAEVALREAAGLRRIFSTFFLEYSLAVQQADWKAAAETANALKANELPWALGSALGMQANTSLYRGRSAKALGEYEQSLAASIEAGGGTAGAKNNMAFTLLEFGEPERALELAQQGRQEGAREWQEYRGRFAEIFAHQDLGRARRADLLVEELAEELEDVPGPIADWALTSTRAALAMKREQWDLAVSELELVEDLTNLYEWEGVEARFDLGRALFETGRLDEAAERFEQVVTANNSRVYSPRRFVRSHDYLGRIHESRGNRAKAREYYQTFLDYWGEGDMDRDRVEAARAFVSGS